MKKIIWLDDVLSTIFSDLTDETTERLASEAIALGQGPFIINIKGNDEKIRGEAPHVPDYVVKMIFQEKRPPVVYKDYARRDDPNLFI